MIRLSLLPSVVHHMPQLKYLKLSLCACDDVDEAERRRLFEMIKYDEMKSFTSIQSFSLISYVKKMPWTIFVRGWSILWLDYICYFSIISLNGRCHPSMLVDMWKSVMTTGIYLQQTICQ